MTNKEHWADGLLEKKFVMIILFNEGFQWMVFTTRNIAASTKILGTFIWHNLSLSEPPNPCYPL